MVVTCKKSFSPPLQRDDNKKKHTHTRRDYLEDKASKSDRVQKWITEKASLIRSAPRDPTVCAPKLCTRPDMRSLTNRDKYSTHRYDKRLFLSKSPQRAWRARETKKAGTEKSNKLVSEENRFRKWNYTAVSNFAYIQMIEYGLRVMAK